MTNITLTNKHPKPIKLRRVYQQNLFATTHYLLQFNHSIPKRHKCRSMKPKTAYEFPQLDNSKPATLGSLGLIYLKQSVALSLEASSQIPYSKTQHRLQSDTKPARQTRYAGIPSQHTHSRDRHSTSPDIEPAPNDRSAMFDIDSQSQIMFPGGYVACQQDIPNTKITTDISESVDSHGVGGIL